MNPLPTNDPETVYRVDKFKVPEAARDPFVQRVNAINQLLRAMPGFVQDLVLEQTGGPGVFNLVTVVVWQSADAMASAKRAAGERYRESGFNPAEFMRTLGVEADLGTYRVH